MSRLLILFTGFVPIVLCLGLPVRAGQPIATRIKEVNGAQEGHHTELSVNVGQRVVVVSEDRRAELEVSVRRLPPDKQAVIFVELRPRQDGTTGTVPMSLPLGRWLRLANGNSGHCLAVEDRSTSAAAKLVQKTAVETDAALLWRLIPTDEGWYILQNRATEQVVSLPEIRKNAGANLIQVPLDKDSLDQHWRPLWLDGNRFVVVNRTSGQALAVAYGATHSGATICQWPLHLDWRQHQWHIEVDDGQ